MGDSSDWGKAALAIATGGLTYVADEAFFAPARRQTRVAKEQAGVQREANRVSAAVQERERQLAIRQQARQERIRRAQVISAAEAAGVGGSSVEASTIGSGQTLAASGQAFATGTSMASEQLTSLNQQSADLSSKSAMIGARGQMFKSAFDLGVMAFGAIPTGRKAGATSTSVQ